MYTSYLKRSLTALAILGATFLANAVEPSGTLPVIYVNTENGVPVTSKEEYVKGTYYLDPKGNADISAIGTAEAPLTLQIRGRGNYTWVGFDKKPYRLKLTEKAKLMGMKKSKHFGLLAHADDNLGFLRNAVGFELSRRMGLAWTPADAPVEYVLNGDYLGVYFLTELIRVDKDRVNIVEQPDLITNPDSITGGWLVEIDNYENDPHVKITEGNGYPIILTYKTPELLSPEQENFLRSQAEAMNTAIYTSDKTSTEWEKYIDIDALARYYVVQEIMDDCESFHGSCYMHRDMGADKKWIFGPVWDFGNAYQRGTNQFIWDEPQFNQTWIGEIYKFPRFQDKVKEVWAEFIANSYEDMTEYIDNYASHISQAAQNSSERWPQYGNADVIDRAAQFKNMFKAKAQFLAQEWGTPLPVDYSDLNVYVRGAHCGWDTSIKMTYTNGVFVANGVNLDGDFKIGGADWNSIDFGGRSDDNKVNIGEAYHLLAKGVNLQVNSNGGKLSNATITFNPAKETLIVDNPLGIEDITLSGNNWSISGLTIHAPAEIRVYTLSGSLVASGSGDFTLSTPGMYIITDNNGASKVTIR